MVWYTQTVGCFAAETGKQHKMGPWVVVGGRISFRIKEESGAYMGLHLKVPSGDVSCFLAVGACKADFNFKPGGEHVGVCFSVLIPFLCV